MACGGAKTDAQQNADPTHAVARGHEAAWMVAHVDVGDTIALQRAILDARAIHDLFILSGEEDAAQEFERAFADSLRRLSPQLANEIF